MYFFHNFNSHEACKCIVAFLRQFFMVFFSFKSEQDSGVHVTQQNKIQLLTDRTKPCLFWHRIITRFVNDYMYLFWVCKFQPFLWLGNRIPIQFPSTSSVPVRLKKHLKSWIYLGISGLCVAARSLRQKLHRFMKNLQPGAN